MVKVFFDTEYTRSGFNTSLISIGFVNEDDERLYIELDDFDRTQVTPWLRKTILSLLEGKSIPTSLAAKEIENWFTLIGNSELIQLVSAGMHFDIILLYNIWAEVEPGSTLRTWRDRLPKCIDHRWHIDLNTIFVMNNIDPRINRIEFAEVQIEGQRHNALYDALTVKACWEKLFDKNKSSSIST